MAADLEEIEGVHVAKSELECEGCGDSLRAKGLPWAGFLQMAREFSERHERCPKQGRLGGKK